MMKNGFSLLFRPALAVSAHSLPSLCRWTPGLCSLAQRHSNASPAALFVQPTEQAASAANAAPSNDFVISKDAIIAALNTFPIADLASITNFKIKADAQSSTMKMYADVGTDAGVRQLLSSAKTIAVVGASKRESTAVYKVMKYLLGQGYTVIPVNPREAESESEILGQRVVASVSAIAQKVDVVDIFLRADRVPAAVQDAIAQGSGAVWTQLDVDVEPETIAMAHQAGMSFVTNRCPKLEIPKLGIKTPLSA